MPSRRAGLHAEDLLARIPGSEAVSKIAWVQGDDASREGAVYLPDFLRGLCLELPPMRSEGGNEALNLGMGTAFQFRNGQLPQPNKDTQQFFWVWLATVPWMQASLVLTSPNSVGEEIRFVLSSPHV